MAGDGGGLTGSPGGRTGKGGALTMRQDAEGAESMSGTALEHQAVRDYLGQLDVAMRRLPAATAKELKEQIVSHLTEELPPDADGAQVVAALARLGTPAQLAAEAGVAPRPLATFMKSVRPRTWIALALVLIAVAVAGKWCDYYLSAGSLQWYNNGADWWYPQDAKHEKIVSIDQNGSLQVQNTAPIRSGQWQGYVVAIFNPNTVTETIVGDGQGPTIGWNNPGGVGPHPVEQLSVSRSYRDIANGFVGREVAAFHHVSFGLPVTIPPFHARLVRVLWISDLCLSKGESQGINDLYLRVRVGWFTRTETIPQEVWDLVGPSQGRNCLG
jgi:hypothetical protein